MQAHPLVALSTNQQALLAGYAQQVLRFNKRINLISRSDGAHFQERHLMHALSLGMRSFPPGASVVDWGTGGGLPGIPLAILFPETTFHLVDATGKKIHAVRHMVRELGLQNVHPWQGRAEKWVGQAHYAVSRATAPLNRLWSWFERVCLPWPHPLQDQVWKPGLICLKGGDLKDEISDIKQQYPDLDIASIPLYPKLAAPYFEAKHILALHRP